MSGQHTQEWIDAACKACEGLTQDHFDGGWTAKELSAYAKRQETELAAACALLREVFKADDEIAEISGSTRPLTERIRSYLDASDTLGGEG